MPSAAATRIETVRPPAGKARAIAWSGLFWVGFFILFFLTRTIVGSFGVAQSTAQASGAMLLIVLLLIWTHVCQRLEHTSFMTGTSLSRGSLPRLLLGLLLTMPLCAASLIPLKWLVPGVVVAFTPMSPRAVLDSALLYLLLAGFEEIAFRGYPLARLLPNFGIWPTLFLIAPIFVLYHLAMGWPLLQAAIGTGIGSLLFGMAAIAARQGLAFPIGVHAGWNFATWSLNSGDGPWRMTFPTRLVSRAQTVGMILYVIFMLVGTAMLWTWTKTSFYPRAGFPAQGDEP
jgi:membrane protease YdiL (CAAX protease family)